MTSNAGNILS